MADNVNLYAAFAATLAAGRPVLELADGQTLSGHDIDRMAARAAQVFGTLGLAPGDRVSVIAEKSPEYLWAYLGCLRAGLVFHPLNPAYTERELAFFFSNAGSRVVIHDPALEPRVAAATNGLAVTRHLTLDGAGDGTFADLLAQAADDEGAVAAHRIAPVTGNDTAALLYSSGTTGTPKGIRITHHNLLSNARALVDAWRFSADDILVHALPVYHVHGLFITLGPALLAGTCLRFLSRFDPAAVVDALDGATMFAGVPTYYGRLLKEPRFGADACNTVRVFISGSAPLSEAAFHAFEARTGHRILERYGMTETGINTSNPLSGERRPGSVGRALPGVEVAVTDAAGEALSTGEIGAIRVRGDNVFPEYWELPEATAAAFDADGWFDTGDQGFLDDDGYLQIVGRSKDLIISGGLNVYPKEVEREVETLDGVVEAAVFGVPHADFGEAVVAAVITDGTARLDPAAATAALKTRLAGFKVPKHLEVLDELPRNAMGKVQKNRLRETYADLFEN